MVALCSLPPFSFHFRFLNIARIARSLPSRALSFVKRPCALYDCKSDQSDNVKIWSAGTCCGPGWLWHVALPHKEVVECIIAKFQPDAKVAHALPHIYFAIDLHLVCTHTNASRASNLTHSLKLFPHTLIPKCRLYSLNPLIFLTNPLSSPNFLKALPNSKIHLARICSASPTSNPNNSASRPKCTSSGNSISGLEMLVLANAVAILRAPRQISRPWEAVAMSSRSAKEVGSIIKVKALTFSK